MPWTDQQLAQIYERTNGYCRYCEKQLAWKNYGRKDERGAWEVDHSVPKAQGGTDHLNNLYAACIPCNRDKADRRGSTYLRGFEPAPVRSSGGDLGDLIVAGAVVVAGLAILSALFGPKGQDSQGPHF